MDHSVFPDPVYKEAVLRPLFDGALATHLHGFRAIDRAHLVMLEATKIIDRATAARIARALNAIDLEVDVDTLVYTGEVEDFFFLVQDQLKQRLGPDVAGRLHTARSRNDIDHTLFKLALKSRIDGFLAGAIRLAAVLLAVARRERDTPIVAYTHGQPAQPTTFGHYLVAQLEVVLRDITRMEAAREIVDQSPMGAAAITTSGFPIDRDLVSTLLGFDRPLENAYGCIASVDYVTATYSALGLFCLHIGRPIQDLQFWTSFEVGQLRVPNAFVQVSSIMPQKRNPVPIEHLRLLASQAMGHAHAMLGIMHNTPYTDMNDSEGETQGFGHAAFTTAGRVLALYTSLIGAVGIDAERVKRNIRRSCITITELADSLVRIEGLSFRQAHAIAAVVAKTVVASEGELATDGAVPFAEAFSHATGRPSTITPEAFAVLVSAEHFIAVRDRFGGPAPAALDAAFTRHAAEIEAMQHRSATHADRERKAATELDRRFSLLLDAG